MLNSCIWHSASVRWQYIDFFQRDVKLLIQASLEMNMLILSEAVALYRNFAAERSTDPDTNTDGGAFPTVLRIFNNLLGVNSWITVLSAFGTWLLALYTIAIWGVRTFP